jgi:hypothetical protein
MEQVDCALAVFGNMFLAQLVGHAKNVSPLDGGMNQEAGS